MKQPLNYYGFAFDEEIDNKRRKSFLSQIKNKGFDSSELWNLDQTIAKFILPRLKEFRKTSIYSNSDSDKERSDLIDKAIIAFTAISNDTMEYLNITTSKEIEEGLDAFAKVFMTLWN